MDRAGDNFDIWGVQQRIAIGWINFLLGWTIIGWIGALIWAIVEKPHEPYQPGKNAEEF